MPPYQTIFLVTLRVAEVDESITWGSIWSCIRNIIISKITVISSMSTSIMIVYAYLGIFAVFDLGKRYLSEPLAVQDLTTRFLSAPGFAIGDVELSTF